MIGYSVSPQAVEDLFEIWQYISRDSERAANEVQSGFYEMFGALGRMPWQGHRRKDLTSRPVLFFRVYAYLIVYQPDVDPIRIMAVLHGRRNIERVLKHRKL